MKHILAMSVINGLFQAGDPAVSTATAGASQPSEVKAPLPAAPFDGVVMTPSKFHFKKNELGEKRPTVELAVPLPTWEGIVAALNDEEKVKDKDGKETDVTVGSKVRDLIVNLLSDQVIGQAREQVSDEKNPVNKQEELNMSRLNIRSIALIPPAERRGGGISKETWEAFFKDYVEVMPEKTGKKKDQVENAAKLFVARLQPVKTQKKILGFLQSQLNLWFTSTSDESREELAEVKEFLDSKIEEFMKRDEAELLANL